MEEDFSAEGLDLEIDAALADPLARGRFRRAAPPPTQDQASRLRELLAIGGIGSHDAATGIAAEVRQAVDELVAHPSGIDGEPRLGGDEPSIELRTAGLTARVVAVTSGKGGVGKTTLAVNLAASLSARGVRTVLVDADLGTANADILCGVTPHARLDHVVTDLPVHDGARRTLADIAMSAPGGFRLVPGSAGIARLADLTEPQQRALLNDFSDLQHETDAILVDTGAGVGRNVIRFVAASDVALVVLTPEPTSLTDAYALIKCLHRDVTQRHGVWTGIEPYGPRVAVVVNEAQSISEARQSFSRLSAVAERFLAVKVYFGGCVAQDVRVGESIRARLPVVLGAPATTASQDIRSLAAYLVREMGLKASTGVRTAANPAARPSLLRRWFGPLSVER
jgi:flagellar biosynthesis protein FlhG